MSKNSSMVNVDSVKDVVTAWNSALNSFEANVPKASSCAGFTSLATAEFDTSCCTTYDDLIDSLTSVLKICGNTVNQYVESVVDSDIQTEQEMPDEADAETTIDADTTVKEENDTSSSGMSTDRDSGSNDGSSGNYEDQANGNEEQLGNQNNGNDGSGINSNQEDSGIGAAAALTDIGKDETDEEYNILDNYFKDLSEEQLKNIISKFYILAKEKNVSLEELITNENYYDAILELLKANNIELSTDIAAVEYRRALYGKFIGENNILGLNRTTKKSLKAYLENYANENSIITSELINNSNYTNIVKEKINEFSKGQEANNKLSLFAGIVSNLSSEDLSYTLNWLLKDNMLEGVSTFNYDSVPGVSQQ